MNKYIKRHLIMFGVAVALSCGIGIVSHVTTYNADGDTGIYVSGLGIEHGHDAAGVDLWLCADSDWVPDFRCPGYQAPAIRQRHPSPAVAVLNAAQDGWQPVTLDLAMSLATVYDREDWTGCRVLYGDTTLIRCPDGWEASS